MGDAHKKSVQLRRSGTETASGGDQRGKKPQLRGGTGDQEDMKRERPFPGIEGYGNDMWKGWT